MKVSHKKGRVISPYLRLLRFFIAEDTIQQITITQEPDASRNKGVKGNVSPVSTLFLFECFSEF